MRFHAVIHVELKADVADVQGSAISQSLTAHGYAVSGVRVGKFFQLDIEAADEEEARQKVQELAQGTFSNPVIENYRFELAPASE